MVCRVPAKHRQAWAQCVVDLVRKDHSAVLDDLIERHGAIGCCLDVRVCLSVCLWFLGGISILHNGFGGVFLFFGVSGRFDLPGRLSGSVFSLETARDMRSYR